MKSLFWIILALLVPFSATAQSRLFFHATIDLPMTGWCDDTSGCDQGGGPINGSMEVRLDDSLPLIVGENHDTLKSAMADWGWGDPCVYSGNYTFQFDPPSHTLYNLQITAAGKYYQDPNDRDENNFAISLDSISLGVVSDSNWTLDGGRWPCTYSSNSYTQYVMMGGTDGVNSASGQGKTTFVSPNANTASVEVSTEAPSSSIQITYLANGAVQIEHSTSGSEEVIEIFDALGRITVRATMDGNVARISNLAPGYYFARLGDQVAKFMVPPR